MSIFFCKYFCAAAWRLARRLLHEGWHTFCYPPPPPQGGEGGGPIMGQVFFIVKLKNRVVFHEGTKIKRLNATKNLLTKNPVADSLCTPFHTFPRPWENQTKVNFRFAIRSNRKDRQPMRSSAPVSGIFHARKPTTAPLSFFLLTKRCFVGRKTL